MRVSVLGSSGGAPTRTNPASGYLVSSGETAIWLDAGTGTFMVLADLVDPGTLSAVVISHIHVDHCADLFGLYAYLASGQSGVIPIRVYVPEGAAAHLAAFARADDDHVFHTVLDVVEVLAGDEVLVGDATIRFGAAIHSVPCLVTRVDMPDGGLVYSGDTGPGSDLASMAAGADLLLCEASLSGARDERSYPYHLTAHEAGAAAAAAGVGRLVLTHFAYGVDPATAVTEAQVEFAGRVDAARPGETFMIGEDR